MELVGDKMGDILDNCQRPKSSKNGVSNIQEMTEYSAMQTQ